FYRQDQFFEVFAANVAQEAKPYEKQTAHFWAEYPEISQFQFQLAVLDSPNQSALRLIIAIDRNSVRPHEFRMPPRPCQVQLHVRIRIVAPIVPRLADLFQLGESSKNTYGSRSVAFNGLDSICDYWCGRAHRFGLAWGRRYGKSFLPHGECRKEDHFKRISLGRL